MKNYLLTDFNTTRWLEIDSLNIKNKIESLNKKNSYIFGELGELGKSDDLDIDFKNVSHYITNLTLVDNKVFGDVGFLDNIKGRDAEILINKSSYYMFGIRAVGTATKITKIFTWDIINK